MKETEATLMLYLMKKLIKSSDTSKHLIIFYAILQSGLSADVMEGFQHFWSEDFEVVHRELGCAIICMSNKFSLMQDDARMHHVNMHDYVKSFPKGWFIILLSLYWSYSLDDRETISRQLVIENMSNM